MVWVCIRVLETGIRVPLLIGILVCVLLSHWLGRNIIIINLLRNTTTAATREIPITSTAIVEIPITVIVIVVVRISITSRTVLSLSNLDLRLCSDSIVGTPLLRGIGAKIRFSSFCEIN